jgi:acetyl-CoA C-acetyltransferase
MDDRVVIAAALRTPFGKFGGAMRECPTRDLSAFVFRHLVERAALSPSEVDEIYWGLATVGESALENGIVARQALLRAGFPPATRSMTIDRACCSSLAAVDLGRRAIQLGEAQTVIVGGADNMGRQPFYIPAAVRWGWRRGPLVSQDNLHELGYPGFGSVARDTGTVAVEFAVSREEQDAWSVRSHRRYAEAAAAGKFKGEIVPFPVTSRRHETGTIEADELPKPGTTLEALAALPTIYGSATVTAGNAPGMDTGAAGLLLMSRVRAVEAAVSPLAEVVACASVATAAERLPVGPALAVDRALERAGLRLEDVDLIEVNEAFAAVPLVAARMLARGDAGRLEWILERMNVNGGAVAVGHPVGASGARILMTLVYELRRRHGAYGVAAICGGLAQAEAIVVRVI